jgi:tetratricopeptide (TPR) repeat protein
MSILVTLSFLPGQPFLVKFYHQNKNMKKLTMSAALLVLSFIALAQNEETAIKNVLKLETETYYKHDLQKWKSLWVQDAQVNRNFISKYGLFTNNGWDSIVALREKMFKQNPAPVPIQFKNYNYTIRSNANMAWVEYDQDLSYPGLDTTNGGGYTREYRMLVKQNGQWKIASQITTFPKSYSSTGIANVEDDLNNTGYQLLAANKVKEAIDVFALNVKLFPASWNTYDSLGEAYLADGNKALAIENYEKSVKLNPKNDAGIEALKKLK